MIEEEIFKYTKVDFKKLIKYGFMKDDNSYVYKKSFMDDKFMAIIRIKDNGVVNGKVIDNDTDMEYFNIRLKDNIGEFTGTVLDEYKNILTDIKNNCFDSIYFMFPQTNRITKYILDKYNDEPEFLWERSQHDGIFRNSKTGKWYVIIMNVDKSKITFGNGVCEVMNLKVDKEKILELLKEKGYYPACHMNKKYWISIILDDTLRDKEIEDLVDESYNLVN